MKIAYLILAHGQYEHLKRLLTALDDPRVHFYIHIDAKSLMPDNLGEFADKITFVEPRVKVWWGGWSIVQAELTLMRTAMDEGGYDYYALLSGQDYPIRPNEWLFRTLEGAGEFISITPLQEMPEHFARRFVHYRFEGFDRHNTRSLHYLIMRSLERLLGWVVRKRWRPFAQMWVGSQWWILSQECVRHLLQVAQNERLMRFFRAVFVPDESFVHSIVGNSPFGDRVRGALIYTHWLEGRSGPEIITQACLPAMEQGEWFFARKFNDASGPICEIIDKTLRQ